MQASRALRSVAALTPFVLVLLACGDDDASAADRDGGPDTSGRGDGGDGASGGRDGGATAGLDADGLAAAIETIGSPAVTLELARSGDGLGARFDRLRSGAVPEVQALVASGGRAIAPLAAELADGPDLDRDEVHATAAFVLGEIGDYTALDPLADFIEDNLAGEVALQAANAATDAVFAILDANGQGSTPSDRSEGLWYSHREMERAISLARLWADLGPIGSALTFHNGACRVRYNFLDAAGNVIQCPDKDGEMRPCAIEGVVFEDVTKVSSESVELHDEAQMHGAHFPPELDGGRASRRYNCAGYAFREINRHSSWTGFASTMKDVLTQAGLLRKKSGEPQPGDKIFFRPSEGWKFWTTNAPAHVAEIDRIEDGKAIVKAPDNFSGVFELPIDAPYWTDVRSWTYELYEWVDGPPRAIVDPDFRNNPSFCGDPFDDHCPNAMCEVELGETSDSCYFDCTDDDGICDPYEKRMWDAIPESPWYQDCGHCGDGFCDHGDESAANCETDCGTCGNGVCDEDTADYYSAQNECYLEEVSGIRCSTDCCDGTTSLCSSSTVGCF